MSSGATRAIATARSASAATPLPVTSLVDTTAWRRPTNTRRPTSSPSERSDSSVVPVAHLDGERHRAHRDRIGGVGAGRVGGLDEPVGAIGQRAQVQEGIDRGMHC